MRKFFKDFNLLWIFPILFVSALIMAGVESHYKKPKLTTLEEFNTIHIKYPIIYIVTYEEHEYLVIKDQNNNTAGVVHSASCPKEK